MLTPVTLLLASVDTSAAAAQPPSTERRFRAAKYGISVGLPKGADVCGPIAPQPNHGVLFRPAGVTSPPCDGDLESGDRYTSVNAQFAPDTEPVSVQALAKEECPELAFDSQGRVTTIRAPFAPGRLPRAACRIDGADGTIITVLFLRRGEAAGIPAIDYTLVLKTTREHYAADYAAFVRWLRTVTFYRPL